MNKLNLLVIILFTIILASCNEKNIQIYSPDKNIQVLIESVENQLSYEVVFKEKTVIQKSSLGFKIEEELSELNRFNIDGFDLTSHNEPWKMVWGERDSVANIYNQGIIYLTDIQDSKRKINLIFKVYNDGIGFRYEFKIWTENLIILDEFT